MKVCLLIISFFLSTAVSASGVVESYTLSAAKLISQLAIFAEGKLFENDISNIYMENRPEVIALLPIASRKKLNAIREIYRLLQLETGGRQKPSELHNAIKRLFEAYSIPYAELTIDPFSKYALSMSLEWFKELELLNTEEFNQVNNYRFRDLVTTYNIKSIRVNAGSYYQGYKAYFDPSHSRLYLSSKFMLALRYTAAESHEKIHALFYQKILAERPHFLSTKIYAGDAGRSLGQMGISVGVYSSLPRISFEEVAAFPSGLLHQIDDLLVAVKRKDLYSVNDSVNEIANALKQSLQIDSGLLDAVYKILEELDNPNIESRMASGQLTPTVMRIKQTLPRGLTVQTFGTTHEVFYQQKSSGDVEVHRQSLKKCRNLISRVLLQLKLVTDGEFYRSYQKFHDRGKEFDAFIAGLTEEKVLKLQQDVTRIWTEIEGTLDN